jgi:uncharacterized linocin/CFP29 family protein
MDILKRSLAPITDRAWQEIDDTVRGVLVTRLCGRRVVDVTGPFGLDKSAVNLGRLEIPRKKTKPGQVAFGVHQVQPLVEGRLNFGLDIWELDNIERGAADIDLDPAGEAALAAARFEDTAVFNGLAEGGITGLTQVGAHDPQPLKLTPTTLLGSLAKAVTTLKDAAIDGPFNLVVGPQVFKTLSVQQTSGYPLQQQVENLVEGGIHYSPVVGGALLISGRGGDFELTIGQDLAVGYDSRDGDKVILFITGSFTFRILDPAAAIYLPLRAK